MCTRVWRLQGKYRPGFALVDIMSHWSPCSSSRIKTTRQVTDTLSMISKGFFCFIGLVWVVFLVPGLPGQRASFPAGLYYPEPVPFSVDARAAQICIDLLRTARFLLHQPPDEQRTILTVRQVWAVYLGQDESLPPGFRRRYDIHVNEVPLDWAHTYVEYGGTMTSLKVLFTYRNQNPGGGYGYLLGN